jgi:hypothetical protein
MSSSSMSSIMLSSSTLDRTCEPLKPQVRLPSSLNGPYRANTMRRPVLRGYISPGGKQNCRHTNNTNPHDLPRRDFGAAIASTDGIVAINADRKPTAISWSMLTRSDFLCTTFWWFSLRARSSGISNTVTMTSSTTAAHKPRTYAVQTSETCPQSPWRLGE